MPLALSRSRKTELNGSKVVELEGVKYVLDVQNRRFGQLLHPTEIVAFHSDGGREIIRAMAGVDAEGKSGVR